MLHVQPGGQQGPARGWGCSISPPVSEGPAPLGWRWAHSLAPRGDAEGRDSVRLSGRRGGALHARVCGHRVGGLRDSWAARPEPVPPLGSAQPWQGAHGAPGLHLPRPEAGNAGRQPDTVGVCGSQSVSHPQPGLPTALHGVWAQRRKTDGSQRKRQGSGGADHRPTPRTLRTEGSGARPRPRVPASMKGHLVPGSRTPETAPGIQTHPCAPTAERPSETELAPDLDCQGPEPTA